MASERDELVSELLARALRVEGVDARSVALPLPYTEHDGDKASLVSTVFLPTPLPEQFDAWLQNCAVLRALLPRARLVAIWLPGDEPPALASAARQMPDTVFHTFEECLVLVASTARQAQPQPH